MNNTEKHSIKIPRKNKTLRDFYLGKNDPKKIPDNYFEMMLELEMTLKNEFNVVILQELINLYTVSKYITKYSNY